MFGELLILSTAARQTFPSKLVQFVLFCLFKISLFIWKTELEKRRDRKRQLSCTCWFSPEMPGARPQQGCSWEPGARSCIWSPRWMQRSTWAISHCLPRHTGGEPNKKQSSWVSNRSPPGMDASITGHTTTSPPILMLKVWLLVSNSL